MKKCDCFFKVLLKMFSGHVQGSFDNLVDFRHETSAVFQVRIKKLKIIFAKTKILSLETSL